MLKTVKFIIVLCSCFFLTSIGAQTIESFSDGNITEKPVWLGNTADWIVNPDGLLQSNDTIAHAAFYLSTANTLATSTKWNFTIQLAFNTSSANYVDAYLTASGSDLLAKNNVGYFVRVGNTTDEISLYRKDSGGAIIKIIDGIDGILNKSKIRIQVIRTAANKWNLLRNFSGTGNDYISEGTTTDSTYTTSSFFGFAVKQSTKSFFKKHYFDDIEVKTYTPDITPPVIQSVNTVTDNSVDILFSEPVDSTSAQSVSNYVINSGIGNPASAKRDQVNDDLVHITFASRFPNSSNLVLSINNVKDLAGNTLVNGSLPFSFYLAHRNDVLIDEIFPDPTPVIGLPNAEFVEVKNTSGRDINLEGWRLASSGTSSKPFPSYTIPVDSFLIITGIINIDSFNSFGKVLGVNSFPSLNNEGTILSLISKEATIINSVSYNNSWFQSDVKSDGGWTLEMIDTKNPCSGASNWKASNDKRGGTPGAVNSIAGNNPDNIAPALLRVAAIDSVTIMLTFSETIDSTSASNFTNYSIPGTTAVFANPVAPSYSSVRLTLKQPVEKDKVYLVTANNISDCSGNVIQALKTVKFGLPSVIDSNDIVINELLFNPKPGAIDYVEIYNRSNKILNLKDLFVANRSLSSNILGSLIPLSSDDILFFPKDYYVLSQDGSNVKHNFFARNPDNFIDVKLPSFPYEEGVAVLLNERKQIIDELHYSSKWHFKLVDNEEGISLERIDYNKSTQSKENWTSAASTSGFGTPSYQNSQFRNDLTIKAEISVAPRTFSPNKDGYEDFTTIHYQMAQTGFVANVSVFDAAGRRVKDLAKNAILGLSGSFTWDGSDDKFNKVSMGTYVIYTEIFNLNGKTKSLKNAVIVAARL